MPTITLPEPAPDVARVCPREEMIARGWHPIANDCTPEEMEYSKEYPAPEGGSYHLFARDRCGDLRLSLAYRIHTGAPREVSTALLPEQLPEPVRAQAEGDIAAAGGYAGVCASGNSR